MNVEQFIYYCDDFQIAEENKISNIKITLKTIITKLRHIIQRMMYNLYKIKKYSIPKLVQKDINIILDKWQRIYNEAKNQNSDNSVIQNNINTLNNSNEFKRLMSGDNNGSIYIDVESIKILDELTKTDKEIEKIEVLIIKSNNESENIINSLLINLLNIKIQVLLKYFKYGKVSNKDKIINLDTDIDAEIDLSTI